MATFQVLLDDSGTVLGTAQVTPNAGNGAPTQLALVARPGQRVIEVDVEANGMDAAALHTAVGARVGDA